MNEAALKERLKIIAAEKESTLNKVWKQLLLERFLARLSSSEYQHNFIFKGGLLLAQYVDINRETIDIDFLMTKIKSEMKRIEETIKKVAAIDAEDGFSFTWHSAEELNQPHMEYTGYRVTLDATFGKMRDKKSRLISALVMWWCRWKQRLLHLNTKATQFSQAKFLCTCIHLKQFLRRSWKQLFPRASSIAE
jgi:predicted nucleotidyltransferase component of viral defense system